MKTQHKLNQEQYQDKSEAYLHSSVHAEGQEFGKMCMLIQQHKLKNILDLGCGGGHVTYQIAAYADQVIAYDLTPEMVKLVQQQSKQKNFSHVMGQVGSAEQLAFDAATFDCIISRYSAHHWQNVGQAMLEMNRVLKQHGKIIIFDILGHSNPVFDSFLQSIEMIRDPSHVRDYSLQEWTHFAEYAGFRIETIEKQHVALNFQHWVQRMQTPIEAINTIRYLQQAVSDEVRKYYQIQDDGSFTSEALYLVLSKN